MAVLVKDIRLKSAIGSWYEYRPDKDYTNDFATANIEAAQIDELLELHHKWAENFGALINQNLKISCGTQETAVSKLEYAGFINHLSGTTTSFEVAANPDFTVIVDNVLAYAFIDRACGGSGVPVKKLNAELTEIERLTLRPLFKEMLNSYKAYFLDAFSSACTAGEIFSPKVKPETKLKKDEDILVFANTFYLADNKPAQIQFVYAEKALEKLVEIYAAKKAAKPRKLTLQLSPDSITNVKVPVNIKIGSTAVTINDILGMAPGDVFQLREKVTDSLVMSIAEQGEFFVQLGKQADKYAVKVVDHKPKYYNFAAPSVTAPAAVVVTEKIVQPAPEPEPEISTIEINEPVQLRSANPVVEDEEQEEIQDEQDESEISEPLSVAEESVEYDSEGKVDEEKLEIKDPLLEELTMPETTDSSDKDSDDDFTWDIDDLK